MGKPIVGHTFEIVRHTLCDHSLARSALRAGEGPNIIYSSVGPVLIALNPFEYLPLYGKEWIEAYHGANPAPCLHMYARADNEYENMIAMIRTTRIE